MGWIIAALVLFLIGSIPLGASVCYDSAGVLVRLVAGVVRFTVFPLPKKKKKPKKNSVNSQKPKSVSQKPPKSKSQSQKKSAGTDEKKQSGGSLLDFLPLVQVGLRMLNTFRKKLRVDRLEMRVIMAGDDPCDLAVNYGRAWAIIDNLLPSLERVLVIGKRDLEVECDFCADQTTIIARLDITITIGRLFCLTFYYGFLAIREFLIIKKKRKGGATV